MNRPRESVVGLTVVVDQRVLPLARMRTDSVTPGTGRRVAVLTRAPLMVTGLLPRALSMIAVAS